MRQLAAILILISAIGASAAESIRAVITVTNAPGVGATLTNAADVRTWTNSLSATTIQTNATIGGSATNLYTALVSYGAANVLAVSQTGTNEVTVYGKLGSALAYGLSAGWGTVSYSTNTATNSFALRVPYAVETTANRGIAATNLLDLFRAHATSGAALATDAWLTNFVNRTGAQAVSAPLALTGTSTASDLTVTNLKGTANGLNGTTSATTNTNSTILTLVGGTATVTNATAISGYVGTGHVTNLMATNATVTNLTIADPGGVVKFGTTNIFSGGVLSNVLFAGTIRYTNAPAYHLANASAHASSDPAAGVIIYAKGGDLFYRGTGDSGGRTNAAHNWQAQDLGGGANHSLAASAEALVFGSGSPSIQLTSEVGVYLLTTTITVSGATAADDIRIQFHTDQAGGDYIGREARIDVAGTGHHQITLTYIYTQREQNEVITVHGYNNTAVRGTVMAAHCWFQAVRLY
jgi:hypothetical protein